jgi:CRISPR-associated protein (TIGR03984 family)
MATLLRRWRAEAMTVEHALAALAAATGPDRAVVLLYSPARFAIGRLEADGRGLDSDGSSLALADVFELRAFTPAIELRWLASDAGGTAVLVTEREIPPGAPWIRLEPVSGEPLPGRYLLWGQGVEKSLPNAADWSRLAEARVGSLDVPLMGISAGQRVQLEAVEYLAEDPEGNVHVAEARLVRLEAVR